MRLSGAISLHCQSQSSSRRRFCRSDPISVSFPASALPKSRLLAVVTHNERIRVKFRYGEVLRFEIEAKKWYVV